MPHMRVLLIEDNPDLADNMLDYLGLQGCQVEHAATGTLGLERALGATWDVVILDLMLPGLDGLELCKRLRAQAEHRTPVLMLTARDTLEDKLAGFEAGTDDYLTKPFSLEELFARLKALGRRAPTTLPPAEPLTLRVADLSMHLGTLEVARAGTPLHLNAACFKILKELLLASPNVVTREHLEEVLWGDWHPASDVLRTHVYELRRLVDKPFEAPLIHTIRGVGYRLVLSDEEVQEP